MIQKLDQALDKASSFGIVICVALMLILTILNISLRWFEVSILWVEPLVRHLVFLAAFLGGSLATGNNNHIRIDVLARILEKKENSLGEWLNRVVTLVTFIAASVLAMASYDLTKIEFEFGKIAFLDIHSGYLVAIIPFGMSLIALRLLLKFCISFLKDNK